MHEDEIDVKGHYIFKKHVHTYFSSLLGEFAETQFFDRDAFGNFECINKTE